MASTSYSLCPADYAAHMQIAQPARAVTTAVIKGRLGFKRTSRSDGESKFGEGIWEPML